ncbi:MAG: UDP-glucose 4-epimerase GalE [Lysobacter sp.]|nr:UDP-glucose 4-epimerase GalE [Lysobacter sp.]
MLRRRDDPVVSDSILVVGGAGYIGSHMCHALLDAGYTVTVLDNLSRGHRDAVDGADLIVGDIRSGADLQACFKRRSYDLVMHFAALAYVGESVSDPSAYYDNNVRGSLHLLDAMRNAGVHRLVFSSTCATYGDPMERPITERHAQNPVNPYGRTKLVVEQALADFARAYGCQSISLRYFNAAGCDPAGRVGERHDPETHLIPLVLEQALRVQNGADPEATDLMVLGSDFPTDDGTCVRDYIHVTDLCRAHLLAAERLLSGGVVGAEAYNLGNGRGYSVLEIIRAARRVTGMDIRYRIAERRPGDPAWLVGCAGKAGAVLGWTPLIEDIDEIVATAWRWMSRRECPAASSAHALEGEPDTL